MRRFDSDPRLQIFIELRFDGFLPLSLPAAFHGKGTRSISSNLPGLE
jgi:hypothetical protein